MTEPLFLQSTLKDYIWGGNKLKTLFGKKSNSKRIAESWELSCNDDGPCTILNGKGKGSTLKEYIEKHGAENVLGKLCTDIKNVPIIKLIDANEPLSIQVHPNDQYAQSKGFQNGKSEMWYVIDADKDAQITYGFIRETNRDELCKRIENGNLKRLLRHVPVHKGDVFYIPAGTIHAIGKGVLIAEVQQNSNLTYRVFDYNRKDANGKKRELHIQDAVAAATTAPTNLKQYCCDMATIKLPWGSRRILCACDYFLTSLETIFKKVSCAASPDVYRHLLILDGEGELIIEGKTYKIKKGDSILLPPQKVDYCIDGHLEYLSTFNLNAEDI